MVIFFGKEYCGVQFDLGIWGLGREEVIWVGFGSFVREGGNLL